MKLVSNWRECYRWLSMHAMVLAASIQGAWLTIPEDLKASIPAGLVSMASIGLLVLGVAGRLVDQKKPE